MLGKIAALLPAAEVVALLAIPAAAVFLVPLVVKALKEKLDEQQRRRLVEVADLAFDAVEGFVNTSPTKVDDALLNVGRDVAEQLLPREGAVKSEAKRKMALDLVSRQLGRDLSETDSLLVRKRLAGRALLSRPKKRR